MSGFPVPPEELTEQAAAIGTDPISLADMLRVANEPGFDQWQEQIRRTGGCSEPIHLMGHQTTIDKRTGETFRYSTTTEPGGRLRLACGNRRASRCPSCAWTYAGDTFHLIRAGITGDKLKHVPVSVRTHPKVFATLTAPSFGPVHNRPDSGRCRCGTTHGEHDPALGTPLAAGRYDYAGAVLWNNHAGQLWQRFTIRLGREIARLAGISQRQLPEVCRISFGKVAEFQRRGAVHLHAIVRLDGPEGAGDEPPAWASTALLDEAIRAAVARVRLDLPAAGAQPARSLVWGEQVDVQPIGMEDDAELTEEAVAAYVAKYATKAAETTGTVDRRIVELADLDRYPELPDHTRRMIEACFDLDDAYPDRLLAHWAHMLGFRGHFSTKSRRYSTTLTALRGNRANFRARQQRRAMGLADPDPDDPEGSIEVINDWRYVGRGHTPGESLFAQSIADDIRINRETAREAMADLDMWEVGQGEYAQAA